MNFPNRIGKIERMHQDSRCCTKSQCSPLGSGRSHSEILLESIIERRHVSKTDISRYPLISIITGLEHPDRTLQTETINILMQVFPGICLENNMEITHRHGREPGKFIYTDLSVKHIRRLKTPVLFHYQINTMQDGINSLQNGMNSAESARQTWSGAKDSILAGNDRAIETLSAVSDQLEAMIPHIETAKEAADTAHDSLGDIVDTVREMQDPLNKLHSALKGIKSGSEDMAGAVPQLNELMQKIIELDARLQASEQAYVTALPTLLTSTHDLEDDYYLGEDWGMDEVPLENDIQATPDDAESDDTGIATYASGAGTSTAVSAASGVMMSAGELAQNLLVRKQYLEVLASSSNKLASGLSSLLDDVADTAKYTSELTDSLEMLTEDTAALYDSMDSYYPDLQATLDDSEELMNRITEALNTSLSTAAIVQNTLKSSSDNLDAATRDSIRGTLELLDKSLSVLDSTASIRHAGVTMKEAIDKEWDDLDGDTRFLNMDPNAEKVSFTSDENQEPESVQIILRTAEISLDDDEEVLDAETEAASQSPLRRIWNVLVKMWKAFVEIFKNR